MQLFKKKAYTLYYEDECINCVDHDVTIGTQTWTGCNLNVTTYRNGDTIPQVTDPTAWANLTTGAWCHYNNDPANDVIYGKLYNWYAINDPRGLAPTGYHIPSDVEWDTLITFLGGDTVAGGKLKEVGLCHWSSPNTAATDQVLFTALPGGARNFLGTSTNIGVAGNWWSSSEANTTSAIYVNMAHNFANTVSPTNSKEYGFSVRLIQDEILSCLNIEVYPPILNPGTNHVVEYLDCDGITQIVTVPNGGTMVTICATEIIANNLNGLTQPLYTLCSPPEPPEFDFTLSQTCSGLDITLVANSIVGGTGPYQFSTTTFSNISDALDNTTWATASTSKNYPLGNVPGIYWVSIKDSLGMITASVIDANCWESLTATREPAVISGSSSAFISGACGLDLTGIPSDYFIATQIPSILSTGDRVFTTNLPGVVPFDGTVFRYR